ncbi:PTS sugar transporter subunit IIB [Neobacillus cucumis]|uniref:PTS sugar transporter subunit IIB n=1 Tax=Neobacillus cucumis TaxID=1740721 RepID=UPI00361BA7FB
MINILLCCAGGMSTSLIARSIQAAVLKKGKSDYVKAMDQDSAEHFLKDFDVVLIAPQLRYILTKLQKMVEDQGIPVAVMEQTDYGLCNGEAILLFAEELFQKNPKNESSNYLF